MTSAEEQIPTPIPTGTRVGVVAGVLLLALPIVAFVLSGPGFVLNNDSVAVPEQALLPWMWGAGGAPPRSVPQDALVAVLDDVVPGWLLHRALMASGVVLLGLGVARLLRGRPVEQVAAAAVAMWSTYVFERSQMGHWALLLGVGALPWVLDAASDVRAGSRGAMPRLLGWVMVGSMVPTAGLLQVIGVTTVLLWPRVRDLRRTALGVLGAIAVQLVWVIPGVATSTGTVVPSEVFALRAEGAAGPVLTALGTGGIWNASVMPASRSGPLSVLAPALLLAIALVGVPRLRVVRGSVRGPLMVLSGMGLVWALLTACPAAESVVLSIQGLPGGGLLRDAQKWLAPWVVLLGVAGGLGIGRIASLLARPDVRGPAATLLVVIPVLLLPDLAFGGWGKLVPVRYPQEWAEVRTALSESEGPGDVVSLPWSSFRSYAWNDRRVSLDPAPRYLPRTVVTDSRLLVQRGDELVVVPSDDPRSAAVGAALLSDGAPAELLGLGVGWVLWQKDQLPSPGYPGATTGVDGRLGAHSRGQRRGDTHRVGWTCTSRHPGPARVGAATCVGRLPGGPCLGRRGTSVELVWI